MPKHNYIAIILATMALVVASISFAQGGAVAQEMAASKIVIPADGLVFETEDGQKVAVLRARGIANIFRHVSTSSESIECFDRTN